MRLLVESWWHVSVGWKTPPWVSSRLWSEQTISKSSLTPEKQTEKRLQSVFVFFPIFGEEFLQWEYPGLDFGLCSHLEFLLSLLASVKGLSISINDPSPRLADFPTAIK